MMSLLLTEICVWAAGLPVWEQETLRRLLAEETFDGEIYSDLASLLLGEKFQDPVDFSGFQAHAPTTDERPILLRISCTRNVNALATNQTLEFSPALTVIFGQNGSGKSGYARILGNACFCRGDRDVLPNLFDSVLQNSSQSADITISIRGRESTIKHDFQNTIAALSGFYVFDSTAVSNHLARENALSFSPFGLSLLRDLVEHTDQVRAIAQSRINATCQPHNFSRLFRGETAISRAIAQLGEKTKLEEAKRLTRFTLEEQVKKRQAETELAQLRSQNIPSSMQGIETEISQLRRLREQVFEIDNTLSESNVSSIQIALSDVEAKRIKATEAGSSQFANPKLKRTGSDAWTAFIRAAKNLALGEDTYPADDSVCLLCQRPLSADAVDLLKRLWEFLEGEARRLLKESETALATMAAGVKALQTNVCSPESAIYQVLSKKAGELLEATERFLKESTDRRDGVIAAINAVTGPKGSEQLARLPPPKKAPLTAIDALLVAWESELEVLKTRNTTKRMSELTALLLEFEHREVLAENFLAIEEYVKGVQWAAKAQKNLNTSRHITTAHNDIFERQVSVEFRAAFEQYVKALGRPLKVKIETRGAKGTALKALQLSLPDGIKHPRATPQYILCEGEKRAVALADFLAEVSIDPSSAGIVLDDPVTSLDQNWKEQIASVLVAESKTRQVIIFTHDLYFLYLLKNAAEEAGAQYQAHWIEKYFSSNTCGHISLNASPDTEREFRTTNPAEKHLKAAKEAASASEKEASLRSGFGAMRTTYEQFVLNDMFGDVVRRFDSRISIERLKDARIDPATVHKVMQKVGELSRYIEGHSHSDEAAHTPTIEALAKEVEEFKVLKSQHKAAKKTTIQANLVSA